MKKLYFLLLLSFFLQKANAQWVTIPDANFVTFLQQNYPSCMNGNQMDTQCSAIINETYLNCVGQNISNLWGIEYFTSLQFLDCSYNQLTTLFNLPPLSTLICHNNQLTSLYLSGSETYLNCANNLLATLPALPNLTDLWCGSNLLTNLPALPNSLDILWCENNQLTNLPTLPNNLLGLYCYNNQLTTIPSLPNTLTHIYCENNLLTSLPNIPTSLIDLKCFNNQLTTLPTLPNNYPYTIDCSNNQISTLPILTNTSLYSIDCSNNILSSLPTLPASLAYLACNDNQITSLPALPPNLAYLICYNNFLTSIPTLPSTLVDLHCAWNQITSLPTLPGGLSALHCQYNQLTNLPNLPNSLQTLHCFNNFLINLPNIPSNLVVLLCDNNQLSILPSLPNSLVNVSASYNQLSQIINFPSNTFLSMYLDYNSNLTCIPIIGDFSILSLLNTSVQCLPNYGSGGTIYPSLPLCSSTINAQITSTATSLCGVSSISLSADTGTGYSYQWQLNGNNISGAASQTYDVTVAGDYTVIVTYNCALDTSNTITITSGAAPSAAISSSGPTSFCSGGSVTLDANTGTGLTYQWQLDGTNISGAISSSYTALGSGNYTVLVSNNCGNSISNIISVTVTSAPGSAGTITGPTSFCRHSTQTFSVAAVSGATNYVWSVPPQATIISGAGSNSITVSFIVKQGDVSVKAANQCGAGPLTVLPVQVLKCANPNSSINSPLRTNRNSETFLFPNPASSEVTIQFNSTEENNYTIKLYDIHGRMVMTQNSIAVEGMNELKLDVKFLSKGIYFVEIFIDNDKVIKKLVVN